MSEAIQLQDAVRKRYAAAAQVSLTGDGGTCCGPVGLLRRQHHTGPDHQGSL